MGLGTINVLQIIVQRVHKAKQPESSDLCGNITEFGMAKGSPEPALRR